MEHLQSTTWRRVIGAIAALCTITGFGWQIVRSVQLEEWPGLPWLLVSIAFAMGLVLFLLQDDTVRLRFRVKRACTRMKDIANESIDVAGGDCSWLEDEIALIERKLDEGVHLRLLCRPAPSGRSTELVRRLAAHRGAEVRRYSGGFDTYLRCIIVDRLRPNGSRLLLIDKERPASHVLGIIPVPQWLRRDHSVTYVHPSSKTFTFLSLVFDYAFEKADPL